MSIRNLRCDAPGADGVRIDRGTRWGNPFVVGRDGTRDEVIAKFKQFLWDRMSHELEAGDTGLLQALAALHGRDLFCWCAPQRCHGEVLAAGAAWAVAELARRAAQAAPAAKPKAAAKPRRSRAKAAPVDRAGAVH